jgi:hypothetical protein
MRKIEQISDFQREKTVFSPKNTLSNGVLDIEQYFVEDKTYSLFIVYAVSDRRFYVVFRAETTQEIINLPLEDYLYGRVGLVRKVSILSVKGHKKEGFITTFGTFDCSLALK